MSLVENKRIARNFIEEMFNKGNVENANRFVTPDFIYHARAEDIVGIDKFKTCVATDHATFHDMHFTYIDGIAEGNKVATTWMLEGIQHKEFRGIPATNKKFETVGVIIFRFEGTLIKEGWSIVDGLTPAIELGLVKTSFNEIQQQK
jgi:predicted ester cyclase